MKKNRFLDKFSTATVAFSVALLSAGIGQAAFSTISFEKEIQPIFNDYCVECHKPGGSGTEASGLDLSTYEGVMKGTKHGAIVSPGDPFTSNLMAVLDGRTDASITMPHNEKRPMNKNDRRILRKWIIGGATKDDYAKGAENVIGELCLDCHIPGGIGYEASGLDMRTYESLMKGTHYGPIIVPGDPVTSNLMVLIDGRAASGLKMPHNDQGEPTPKDKIKLRRWINQGAQNN